MKHRHKVIPSIVIPLSTTPLGRVLVTTFFISCRAWACNGALKHLIWNSFNSVSSKNPSLLMSDILKILFKASSHSGFSWAVKHHQVNVSYSTSSHPIPAGYWDWTEELSGEAQPSVQSRITLIHWEVPLLSTNMNNHNTTSSVTLCILLFLSPPQYTHLITRKVSERNYINITYSNPQSNIPQHEHPCHKVNQPNG